MRSAHSAGERLASSPTCGTTGASTHAIGSGLGAFGRLDIVLANAGIAPMSVKDHEHAWQDVINVNLTGAQSTLRVTAPC